MPWYTGVYLRHCHAGFCTYSMPWYTGICAIVLLSLYLLYAVVHTCLCAIVLLGFVFTLCQDTQVVCTYSMPWYTSGLYLLCAMVHRWFFLLDAMVQVFVCAIVMLGAPIVRCINYSTSAYQKCLQCCCFFCLCVYK